MDRKELSELQRRVWSLDNTMYRCQKCGAVQEAGGTHDSCVGCGERETSYLSSSVLRTDNFRSLFIEIANEVVSTKNREIVEPALEEGKRPRPVLQTVGVGGRTYRIGCRQHDVLAFLLKKPMTFHDTKHPVATLKILDALVKKGLVQHDKSRKEWALTLDGKEATQLLNGEQITRMAYIQGMSSYPRLQETVATLLEDLNQALESPEDVLVSVSWPAGRQR